MVDMYWRPVHTLATTFALVLLFVLVLLLSQRPGPRTAAYASGYQRYSWRGGFKIAWCKGLRFRPPGRVVALVSHAGSGNTWLRYLLQQATGIMTGSKYCDYGLKAHGFPAENVSDGTVLVVKTHELHSKYRVRWQAAVLLIRHPKDAILAEYHRLYKGHLGIAPISAFKPRHQLEGLERVEVETVIKDRPMWWRKAVKQEWPEFLNVQLRSWELLNSHWLTYFRGPILVVFYEALVRDTGSSLERILDFLNYTVTKDDIRCALANREGIYRRRKKLQGFNPFTPDLYLKLENSKDRIYNLVYSLQKLENRTILLL